MVIIRQKTLREKLGIDVMAQLKASVLKVHGSEDGPQIEITAGDVGEPNAGTVLRAAMAVTSFGPGGDAPGDVDDDAVDHGLPPECAKMLRDIVFRTHLDVFRRALLGDPPARVEPMTVRLQPGARAVRAKPRASPPAKAAWLHEHMANLETSGIVFRNRMQPTEA